MNYSFITMAMALIFSNSACAQSGRIIANKNYTTKEVITDGNFNAVKLMGSPDVIYTQTNGKTHIEIYGSDNIVDLLDVFVEKGTLIVKYKSNTQIQNNGKLEVRVSAPALNRMEVHGSGDITLTNGITTNKDVAFSVNGSGDIDGSNISCSQLTVTVNGSGDIKLNNLKTESTGVQVNGSGDIALSGTTQTANYSVSGSGDISAAKLEADNVSAKVSGSGDITCHAVTYLKARINGSGGIAYKGKPEIDSSKKGLRKL